MCKNRNPQSYIKSDPCSSLKSYLLTKARFTFSLCVSIDTFLGNKSWVFDKIFCTLLNCTHFTYSDNRKIKQVLLDCSMVHNNVRNGEFYINNKLSEISKAYNLSETSLSITIHSRKTNQYN